MKSNIITKHLSHNFKNTNVNARDYEVISIQ